MPINKKSLKPDSNPEVPYNVCPKGAFINAAKAKPIKLIAAPLITWLDFRLIVAYACIAPTIIVAIIVNRIANTIPKSPILTSPSFGDENIP